MEKLGKDVFNHIIKIGHLTGKNLVSFTLVNRYINRSCFSCFLPALKKEFEIYRLNRWHARKLYVKMYQIKENYKTLTQRFSILNKTEEGIHDNRPVYNATYLYQLLYAKYTYQACPFLSSIIEETQEMEIFYDNINIVIQNRVQSLSKEEYILKYGSERAFFKSVRERYTRYETIDLENIWFDEVKPEVPNSRLTFKIESPYGGMWDERGQSRYEGCNINVNYIDSLWNNTPNIIQRGMEKVDRSLSRHFLEANICTTYENCIEKFSSSLFKKSLIENCKREDFNHDIYKLTRREIGMIISLHDLFMEGIISITMPMKFLLQRNNIHL